MLYKDVKLEERGERDPKFNPKNKTDRKILLTVIISCAILIALIAGLIVIYYRFFYGGNADTSSAISSLLSIL